MSAAALTAGLIVIGGGMAQADTTGAGGILSGNQISIPITAPITACGNAIGALGQASSDCVAKVTLGETVATGHAPGRGHKKHHPGRHHHGRHHHGRHHPRHHRDKCHHHRGTVKS